MSVLCFQHFCIWPITVYSNIQLIFDWKIIITTPIYLNVCHIYQHFHGWENSFHGLCFFFRFFAAISWITRKILIIEQKFWPTKFRSHQDTHFPPFKKLLRYFWTELVPENRKKMTKFDYTGCFFICIHPFHPITPKTITSTLTPFGTLLLD